MPTRLFPEVIRNLKLFQGVSPDEIADLLSESRVCWYKRGDLLFHQGDPVLHFYIVCTGTFETFKQTPDGKKITTDVVVAGKTMCKTEIFKSPFATHQVSACAVNDATVLEFPYTWLKKAVENHTIALNILSAVSHYAHMVEVEAEHKTTMSAPQQVACFLHRMYLLHDFNPKGFTLPYSKRLIASRLGMEPETFSRAISRLREYGITINGNQVIFNDVQKVEQYVCEHCSIVGECSQAKMHADLDPRKVHTS